MKTCIVRALLPLPVQAAHGVPAVDEEPPFSDYDLSGAPRPRRVLRAAAVLVPLVERAAGLAVLLTERTRHLRDHPGQVSFPGGSLEEEDAHAVAAALREAREEIGLPPAHVTPAGCLDDYETVTGYRVTPVVGFVRAGFALELDPFEVADAFEVPLEFFFEDLNRHTHSYERDGARRRYYAYEYGPHYIWGATAGMLVNLVRRVRGDLA